MPLALWVWQQWPKYIGLQQQQQNFPRNENSCTRSIWWKMPWSYQIRKGKEDFQKGNENKEGKKQLRLVFSELVPSAFLSPASSVWTFEASFQYPWTYCFFRPSLLCIRIHEFPIFVIAYLQGWALAAGIAKEKERRTDREGEGYQRWCLVDRRILRFKWAMFYWLYRKNHSVTLSSIFPSLSAAFDNGGSFCFHITLPLHITCASQLLCAIMRVERKHG